MTNTYIGPIKRGDVRVVIAECSEDLAGVVIRSTARNRAIEVIAQLPINIVDAAAGQYEITLDTTDMPLGDVLFDVRYEWPGGSVTTETARFTVVRAMTEPQ